MVAPLSDPVFIAPAPSGVELAPPARDPQAGSSGGGVEIAPASSRVDSPRGGRVNFPDRLRVTAGDFRVGESRFQVGDSRFRVEDSQTEIGAPPLRGVVVDTVA